MYKENKHVGVILLWTLFIKTKQNETFVFVFGSCFRSPAVILVSDFGYFTMFIFLIFFLSPWYNRRGMAER